MAGRTCPCRILDWAKRPFMHRRPLGIGGVFVGWTRDWTEKANSALRVSPRRIERTGAVAENPHKWTSRYGSLVITGYDLAVHEGVNEMGWRSCISHRRTKVICKTYRKVKSCQMLDMAITMRV